MKTLLISLTLITASLACNHRRVPGEWELIPNSNKFSPACPDGVSKCEEQAVAVRDWICPDSSMSIADKKDSILSKAMKPKP